MLEAITKPDSELELDDDIATTDDDKIFCTQCGNLITRSIWRISRNGDHQHTVFNPAGQVYQIVCYGEAEGVGAHGQASDDFTWFAGYHWQVIHCRNCMRHMGWLFRGDDIFFALIKSHITHLRLSE